MTTPLHIDNLTKRYRIRRQFKTAVDGLSLDVPEGVVFGFLGPNGAGKTTTIKAALDFIRPTCGTIQIFGAHSCHPRARQHVGYLPEQPYFPRFLRPRELLSAHAALAGVSRAETAKSVQHALDTALVADYADIPISKLSKGLTQRVALAQALIGQPRLLILDEPTSGLDPVGRRHVRDILLSLKSKGTTVFLSSHLLSEAEQVCDTIAIVRQGRLVFLGRPDEAKSTTDQFVITTTPLAIEQIQAIHRCGATVDPRPESAAISIGPPGIFELMRILETTGARVVDIAAARETMEEAFLRLAA